MGLEIIANGPLLQMQNSVSLDFYLFMQGVSTVGLFMITYTRIVQPEGGMRFKSKRLVDRCTRSNICMRGTKGRKFISGLDERHQAAQCLVFHAQQSVVKNQRNFTRGNEIHRRDTAQAKKQSAFCQTRLAYGYLGQAQAKEEKRPRMDGFWSLSAARWHGDV